MIENKKQMAKTAIASMIVIIFLVSSFLPFLSPSNASVSVSQPIPASIQTLSSTSTKFFNLTFIEDHNFTNGIGNWTARSGGWTCQGGEYYSAISTGAESAIDATKPFYDGLITIDYYQIKNPSYPNDVAADFYTRWNGLTTFGGAKGYGLGVSSGKLNDSGTMYAELSKWHDNTRSSNWYYGGTVALQGNGLVFNQIYNSTWIRLVQYVVGNDISCSWNNLSMASSTPSTWRISVLDSESVAGTNVITSGLTGLRTYRSNLSVRQILFDYPYFPISIRAGQSISVHMTSNYTAGVISGTPTKGALQNGWWNFTSSLTDIGTWNETFTMTNATKTVNKQIQLSVFPDLSNVNNQVFYPGNPIIPNAPGNTSNQIYDPSVILDTDGKYKMWVSVAQPAPYAGLFTYFYESTDGLKWETNGWTNPLTIGDNSYEKPCVIKNGTYYEMVTGKGDRSGLYHFRSTNGYTWTIMNGGNPILTPSLSWEENAYQGPSVKLVSGIYYVTFGIGGIPGIGTAEPRSFSSATGISLEGLTKATTPPIIYPSEAGANISISYGGNKIVRYENCWLAIENGFSVSGASHATLAMTLDLIHWNYYPDVSAFPLNSQSWESAQLYTGTVMPDQNGALGFWLNGKNVTGKEQIGFMAYIPQGLGLPLGNAVNLTGSIVQNNVRTFGRTIVPIQATSIGGTVSINVSSWIGIFGGTECAWNVTDTSGAPNLTYYITGLQVSTIYQYYIDGSWSRMLTSTSSGTLSFSYSGSWSTHEFELIETSVGPTISGLVNVIFIMFAIGVVVGVIVEGTKPIRDGKMLTSEQQIKSLVNMVIYIVIGIAGVGVLYSIVA
jgi:hypothetical protein